MSYEGGVYFILDEGEQAIKIGKADILEERLKGLQTGNPRRLKVVHFIDCKSSAHSNWMEKRLHKQFKHLRGLGEWFEYKEQIFKEFFTENLAIQIKEKRSPLTRSTLFGEETWGREQFPSCYIFPELTAQILGKYENVEKWTLPFRTMKYPTNGKRMLGTWSAETDRVFISTKMHNILLNMNRFNRMKESEAILVEPKDEPSTLEIFFSKVDPPGKNFEILNPA